MRAIPESLKVKMRLLAQTKANNADPRVESIISRHVIPIQDYSMWKTFKIANFSGRVSIAVPRPDYRRGPKEIFVAGIEAGVAKVYSADFDGINAPEFWTQVLTIPGAVEISMAYEGRFRPLKRTTEFYTQDSHPWVFWIDATGDLHARHWDDATTETIIGANTTSCSATMGINSVQNDWGYGLIAAWTTTAGAVFYAQLIDGLWGDGITVTQAPANATEIVVSRVNDARMTFLIKDSTGAVTNMFFRSVAISMSNFEKVEVLTAKAEAPLIKIAYHDPVYEERAELTEAVTEAFRYSIFAPKTSSAANINDGAGNFGRFVMLGFEEAVYGFDAADFTLVWESGVPSSGLTITRPEEYDRRMLIIEFQNFNNATGVCTITYTPTSPGKLTSGVTLAPLLTQTFTPIELIPTVIPTPVPIYTHSLNNFKINVTFDLEVTSHDFTANTPAFIITGQEPNHSVDPTLISPVIYQVESVGKAPEDETGFLE